MAKVKILTKAMKPFRQISKLGCCTCIVKSEDTAWLCVKKSNLTLKSARRYIKELNEFFGYNVRIGTIKAKCCNKVTVEQCNVLYGEDIEINVAKFFDTGYKSVKNNPYLMRGFTIGANRTFIVLKGRYKCSDRNENITISMDSIKGTRIYNDVKNKLAEWDGDEDEYYTFSLAGREFKSECDKLNCLQFLKMLDPMFCEDSRVYNYEKVLELIDKGWEFHEAAALALAGKQRRPDCGYYTFINVKHSKLPSREQFLKVLEVQRYSALLSSRDVGEGLTYEDILDLINVDKVTENEKNILR